jgi:hypothetical protein
MDDDGETMTFDLDSSTGPEHMRLALVAELGKNLSPLNLQRSCNPCEFGDMGGKEPSIVFSSLFSEE